jgi:membrane protease YdiL (CAAX protease family)
MDEVIPVPEHEATGQAKAPECGMDEVLPVPEDETNDQVKAPRKGHPILAWIVIIGLVVFLYARQAHLSEERASSPNDQTDALTMQLQARYLVGAAQFTEKSAFESQIVALNTGPVSRRLRAIILIGEISGPTRAEELLKELDSQLAEQKIEPGANDKSHKEILKHLYADYAQEKFEAPSVQADERAELHKDLGWFGDLALAPQGGDEQVRAQVLQPAFLTTVGLLAFVALGLMAAVAGLFGLVFLIVFFYTGRVRAGIRTGLTYGGLYAETFAIWLAMYPLLSLAVSFIPAGRSQLLVQGSAMLLSLSVVFWPVLRGVPWRQVRQDIGLTGGRWPALEPLFGVGGYAMTLPLLGIAVVIMAGILAARGGGPLGAHPENNFGPIEQPSHPIVNIFASRNWWLWLQAAIVAAVLAPLVEETMFRGVLYRHLREASDRLGFTVSVLLSALAVSFVFAVIHPQGLIALPGLMALALGFALLREWRGALIPCMVAHGINNGMLTLVFILAAS